MVDIELHIDSVELKQHREAIANVLSDDGFECDPNGGAGFTLVVNGQEVWHEASGRWLSWYLPQATDASHNLDWSFRIAAEWLDDDMDHKRHAEQIKLLLKYDHSFGKLQNRIVGKLRTYDGR